MAVLIVVALIALAVLVAAIIDNRRLGGRRLFAGRRHDGDLRFQAPDPHGPLSPADRDAWFGGGSGV
jgi:hypothetical protein